MQRDIIENLIMNYVSNMDLKLGLYNYDVAHYAKGEEEQLIEDMKKFVLDTTKKIRLMPYEMLEEIARQAVAYNKKLRQISIVCQGRRFREEEPECQ